MVHLKRSETLTTVGKVEHMRSCWLVKQQKDIVLPPLHTNACSAIYVALIFHIGATKSKQQGW